MVYHIKRKAQEAVAGEQQGAEEDTGTRKLREELHLLHCSASVDVWVM
jgi:hypothetical protein